MKPMVRGNICLNAHPAGCRKSVEDQIEYTKKRASMRASNSARKDIQRAAPKNVLVLGCSNGYGLASRIVSAFGYGAATIGVSFEKAGTEKKWGTPGWYNNLAFDSAAEKAGIFALTFDGDAFSDAVKADVIQAAREKGMKFDLVIYSLASPVRTDPESGVMYKSVIKPIGRTFSGKTIDQFTGELKDISAEPANEEEIANTVKVMGGEDWERWIAQLSAAGTLADGCMTVAYSYIGPELSQAIYRNGTIGKAKEHLEATAEKLRAQMAAFHGSAYVSVNKGLVTRASAVIPIIPLYLATLFKVMKARGRHEGCIEQINRLFDSRLFGAPCGSDAELCEKLGCRADASGVFVDDEQRIRIDDWELDPEIQREVNAVMPQVTSENSAELTDLAGYQHDFLATSGFDIAGVDYDAEVARFDTI
ncbi:MAG: trans-2-enoyl-CoA reductase family protein [Bacteroides sp.]|nr:trans-2-enoyl-CoA reductase family protein [Prevotella sp.]MCM1407221.1 trans-2-enoyl-CoA reductase family protein [Treponema brennaborense]MCM1470373.1 trans-2-enoyl-CoA reductase family protein [Bacteroides sp.]